MSRLLHLSIAFSLITAAFPASAVAEDADAAVGRVIGIKGQVEFLRQAQPPPVAQAQPGQTVLAAAEAWQTAAIQQPVFKNDRFRTSRKSRLKILLSDNTLFALGPKSEIQVGHYMHKPEDKLRQGVVGLARGMSMYIINKNQDNPKSYMKIETPTGNLAARGTHGYIGVTPLETLVANQAGALLVRNREPGVPGQVIVGVMMKTIIRKGQPPDTPVPLTPQELLFIRNLVLGRIGASGQDTLHKKPLIEVELDSYKKKGKSGAAGSSGSGSDDGAPEGGTTELVETDLPGFTGTDSGEELFGDPEDYESYYFPFDDSQTESCKVSEL